MYGIELRKFRGISILLAGAMVAGMLAGSAVAQTKVALINVQEAISRTAEGQKLIRELQERYQPTQQELAGKSSKLTEMRDQLQKGANTMSEEARRNLTRDIQKAELELKRRMEDAQGEFSQEQNQLFNTIGSKMITVIDRYSKDNGLHLVMDISSHQSLVLYAVNEMNITNQIIETYDATNPVAASGSTTE